MVFRFKIYSEEADNFKCEALIDASSTFLDLYDVIAKACSFDTDEAASFFTCDEEWAPKKEISRFEPESLDDEDPNLMDSSYIEDFLEEEKDRLLFTFDLKNNRSLYLSLDEILPSEHLSEPSFEIKKGIAPKRHIEENIIKENSSTISSSLDESFFGDKEFNEEELEMHNLSEDDDIENKDSDSSADLQED